MTQIIQFQILLSGTKANMLECSKRMSESKSSVL